MRIQFEFFPEQTILTVMDAAAEEWCKSYDEPAVTLYPSAVRSGRYFLQSRQETEDFLSSFVSAGGVVCEAEVGSA